MPIIRFFFCLIRILFRILTPLSICNFCLIIPFKLHARYRRSFSLLYIVRLLRSLHRLICRRRLHRITCTRQRCPRFLQFRRLLFFYNCLSNIFFICRFSPRKRPHYLSVTLILILLLLLHLLSSSRYHIMHHILDILRMLTIDFPPFATLRFGQSQAHIYIYIIKISKIF